MLTIKRLPTQNKYQLEIYPQAMGGDMEKGKSLVVPLHPAYSAFSLIREIDECVKNHYNLNKDAQNAILFVVTNERENRYGMTIVPMATEE